jgi:hypothetical protein
LGFWRAEERPTYLEEVAGYRTLSFFLSFFSLETVE